MLHLFKMFYVLDLPTTLLGTITRRIDSLRSTDYWLTIPQLPPIAHQLHHPIDHRKELQPPQNHADYLGPQHARRRVSRGHAHRQADGPHGTGKLKETLFQRVAVGGNDDAASKEGGDVEENEEAHWRTC